ncbi:MAG: transglutaminase-like domain-containing protein [Planctomycetota bacterium]|jgi:hypothetical protein
MRRAGIVAALALAVVAGLYVFTARPIPPRTPGPTAGPVVEPGAVIAERGYEHLLHGRRSAVQRVTWNWAEHEGRRVVRDITQYRSRSARDMAGTKDVFETATDYDVLRTPSGELLKQHMERREPGRISRETIVRTAGGYKVDASTGANTESFEIESAEPVQVDVETFLGPLIKRGNAKPGKTYTYRALDVNGRRVLEPQVTVIGPDKEGPGLKVEEALFGRKTLWWFADDGSVVRLRAGDSVMRRADHIGLKDLPRRPATYAITLPSDVDLPRIFTGQSMVVDVHVRTDDTVRPPRIPDNPFTRVETELDDTVRLVLLSHDKPDMTAPLPIAAAGFEEYLKATRLMEVDDPEVRDAARRAVGEATDARTAARNISDFVFRLLRKGSPELAQPSAKEILADCRGDCSEHCLLFTTLCRAAGIPARRCSGWVCIGSDWGGHAWCEIWVGEWIGADPTTNEIGTRARYIFCARQDEPEVVPAAISAERTRIRIRAVEYPDGVLDLAKRPVDAVLFSGIRVAPDATWKIVHNQAMTSIIGPGFRADMQLRPDHGYRALDILRNRWRGQETLFGGYPALRGNARQNRLWVVSLGREILTVYVRGEIDKATLERALKPTLDRKS